MLLCAKRHYFHSRTYLPLCPLLSLTFCSNSLTSSHKTCVGGNLPPRTPMGTEPLSGSAGGRRSREERIEAMHTRGLPSFGPHGCVKPYFCFVVCIVFLFESAECYSTLRQLIRPSVSGLLLSPPSSPSRCAWGLLLYAQGVTHRWQRRWG